MVPVDIHSQFVVRVRFQVGFEIDHVEILGMSYVMTFQFYAVLLYQTKLRVRLT